MRERSSGLVIAKSTGMVGAQPPSNRLRRGSRASGRAVRPLAVGSPHSAMKRLRGRGSRGLLVLWRAAHQHASHRPEPVHAAPEKLDFLLIEAPHRACQAASRSSTLGVSSKSVERVTRSVALLPSSSARHAACGHLTPPSRRQPKARFARFGLRLTSNVRSPAIRKPHTRRAVASSSFGGLERT